MVNAPAPIVVVSGPSGVGKSTVSRLVAAAFEQSALVEADAFMSFISAGWVEPNLPQASHQNDVIGMALVAATLELAAGGYTTVVRCTTPSSVPTLPPVGHAHLLGLRADGRSNVTRSMHCMPGSLPSTCTTGTRSTRRQLQRTSRPRCSPPWRPERSNTCRAGRPTTRGTPPGSRVST
jgi:hypothetical protein